MPTLEEMVSKLRPRPTRMQERPTHPELAVEHDRFMEMLPELLKTIPGKWIAMRDGEILAVGDSPVRVLTAANRIRPGVHLLSRLVTDQPLPIERLPVCRERPRSEPSVASLVPPARGECDVR